MTHRIVISTDGADFVVSHPADGGGETKVTLHGMEETLEYVATLLGKDARDKVRIVRPFEASRNADALEVS